MALHPRDTGAGTKVVVKTRGLTSLDVVVQSVLVIVGIAIMLNSLMLRTSPTLGWERLALVGSGIVLLLILDLVVTNKTHVLRVEIDATGVTFVFPFHQEHADGSELGPVEFPARFGDWGVTRTWADSEGVKKTRRIPTTVAESRAILSHPGRPKWIIPSPVAVSLGVSPE